MDRLYVLGGADCAWIVAVAHWLLELRVKVLDQDGITLYQPLPDAQVIIAYTQSAHDPQASLQVLQKQYVIPSGHVLLNRRPRDQNDILSYDRVAWDTCLTDTFGSPMKRLLGSQA